MANIIQINGYTISSSNAGGGASDFPYTGSAIISGSLIVTGSTTSTLGFTGSLFGTSSWAENALTSNTAITASYLSSGSNPPFISLNKVSSLILSSSKEILLQSNNPGGTEVINLYATDIILSGSSTGATTVLSYGNILPGDPYTNNVSNYDLGATSAAWKNIYANNLTALAGTNTIPPIKLTAGTNLTSPTAGAIEYDGTTLYRTNDTTSGRGYEPSTQIFRLTANGSSITTIANFFGANSAIQLAAGGAYEIEAYCYFAKLTTNSTVVVTITTSAAPVNLNAILQYGLLTNGGAAGAANQVALFGSTSTSATLTSGTLTATQNHAFTLRLILDANASASNLRINFTSTAGSVTPYRNSYYKVTKLPSSNVGNFTA